MVLVLCFVLFLMQNSQNSSNISNSNKNMETTVTVERIDEEDMEDLPSPEILRENMMKSRSKQKKYTEHKCPQCSKVFSDKSGLREHIQRHGTERPYSCSQCEYTAKSSKYISRHFRRVHSGDPRGHACRVCGKDFWFRGALENHMRVHTGAKPYKCDVCGKAFSAQYSLATHKYIHTDEKPFKCPFCEYACRDSSTLRKHKQRHLGLLKQFHCELCPKKYDNSSKLKEHMRSHEDPTARDHQCEQCGGRYKTKSSLRSHVAVVHAKRDICACPVCEKSMSRSNLKAHLRRHLHARPYRCGSQGCDASFKDQSDLKKHRRIHDISLQYVCDVCGARFSRKSRVARHLLQHSAGETRVTHNLHTRSDVVKRTRLTRVRPQFHCDMCDFVTHNKPSIAMHIKYGHDVNKKGKCRICGKVYKRIRYLGQHYATAHNIQTNALSKQTQKVESQTSFEYTVKIKEEPLDSPPDLEVDLLDIEKEEPFAGFEAVEFELDPALQLLVQADEEQARGYEELADAGIEDSIAGQGLDVELDCPRPEDSREMMTEIIPEQTTEGIPEETTEDISVNIIEGAPGDTWVNIREEIREGIPEQATEGIPEETRQDIPKGTRDIIPEETREVIPGKTREVVSEEIRDVNPEETRGNISEETGQNIPKDITGNIPKQNTEYIREETREGIPEDTREVIPEGTTNKDQGIEGPNGELNPPKRTSMPVEEFLQQVIGDDDEVLQDGMIIDQASQLYVEKRLKRFFAKMERRSGKPAFMRKRNYISTMPLPDTIDIEMKTVQNKGKEIQVKSVNNAMSKGEQISRNEDDDRKEHTRESAKKKIRKREKHKSKCVKKISLSFKKGTKYNAKDISENEDDEKRVKVRKNNKKEKVYKTVKETNKGKSRKYVSENEDDEDSENALENNNEEENLEDTDIFDPNEEDLTSGMKKREIPMNLKELWKMHQCYVCFQIFETKPKLIEHCKQHFDVCNDITLKKCPLCPYVTSKSDIKTHLRKKHREDVDISFMRIKDRKVNDTVSRYYYDTKNDKIKELEIIPSVKILNKKASMEFDKRRRERNNKFLGKPKLVKKGNEWIVEKEKLDLTGHVLPDEKLLDKKSKDYMVVLKKLGKEARRKGVQMLYPCNKCSKVCQNLSALTLHGRKHDPNPKPFKPRGYKKTEPDIINAKAIIEHRNAKPNPVRNNHKCDPKLIDFYEENIKGGDIEFWQFLKIYNKMDRERVNTFEDLQTRTEFGVHVSHMGLDEATGVGGSKSGDLKSSKKRSESYSDSAHIGEDAKSREAKKRVIERISKKRSESDSDSDYEDGNKSREAKKRVRKRSTKKKESDSDSDYVDEDEKSREANIRVSKRISKKMESDSYSNHIDEINDNNESIEALRRINIPKRSLNSHKILDNSKRNIDNVKSNITKRVGKSKFVRKIRLTKLEHKRRMEIKMKMREKLTHATM